ncbi:unnamed protein product [Periconia digitata]|uniref:Uncharacterized protein n=1 Tax=Periconia digitata TaxID=1303443 RepID=A0A9W4XVD5_9PLEO|nr:unnamed protein product [Periconia digitata]
MAQRCTYGTTKLRQRPTDRQADGLQQPHTPRERGRGREEATHRQHASGRERGRTMAVPEQPLSVHLSVRLCLCLCLCVSVSVSLSLAVSVQKGPPSFSLSLCSPLSLVSIDGPLAASPLVVVFALSSLPRYTVL